MNSNICDAHRQQVADHRSLDAPRLGPQLGEHGPGERQVPRLLLAVVPVHLGQEGVGVGMLGRQLLQEVGDLLAREDHHVEGGAVADEPARHQSIGSVQQPALGERVAGLRAELAHHALEHALVAGLLAHLVAEVGDAGIGDVFGLGDLEREAGLEDRLEADAGVEHRRHLLAAEDGPLLRGEVEVEPGHREQLVGDHLAWAHLARQVDIGLHHPTQRRSVQALDALHDGGSCHGWMLNRLLVGCNAVRPRSLA
ncbi:MAG: hypothetical protein R2701_02305 [Acidimicrobiales bacterium]